MNIKVMLTDVVMPLCLCTYISSNEHNVYMDFVSYQHHADMSICLPTYFVTLVIVCPKRSLLFLDVWWLLQCVVSSTQVNAMI